MALHQRTITSVLSVFHHTIFSMGKLSPYKLHNFKQEHKLRYFITVFFFYYFFLKKVEMFFEPDAALARALSFAVMEGLAACNTIHSTSYN